MHPIVILIPAAALILGPRAWAGHLLKKHNKTDLDLSITAGDFARGILDRRQLQMVKVESTDIVDHYDHLSRTVRISRSRFDRKTLTALTTAAHEVAHALQDASGYAPFVWRAHFTKVAQTAGQVGSILLLAVPLFCMTTRRPFPLFTMGITVFMMLGAGLVAQLAALPSEFDASFNRALPMLRSENIDEAQLKDARTILIACSTTYVAASMVSVLHFWPWFMSGSIAMYSAEFPRSIHSEFSTNRSALTKVNGLNSSAQRPKRIAKPYKPGSMRSLARKLGKPLIRSWIQFTRAL